MELFALNLRYFTQQIILRTFAHRNVPHHTQQVLRNLRKSKKNTQNILSVKNNIAQKAKFGAKTKSLREV